MKRIIIHIKNLFYLAFLLFMVGCENEVMISEKPEETVDDKVKIEIFTRADSYQLPATRGVTDEGTVGLTPWILVFKGNDAASAKFVEAVQAFEFVGKRYVLLTGQPAGTKYQLLILANPQNEFYYGDANTGYEFKVESFTSNLSVGVTTLSDACRKLLTGPLTSPSQSIIPFSGDGETIPMSYLLQVDEISSSTKIEGAGGTPLELIRVVSKVVIANNSADFEFKGITAVVNVPRQGQLHNITGSVMDNTSHLTELRYDGNYSSLLVTATNIDGGQSTIGEPVYLFESDIPNDTYFIIQGTFEGRDYYYKMALVDNNQALMDLLRNRAYTFTITNAHGPGYDTIEDVKASKASNTGLDFSVLVDDSNTYEIMANNDYYLGVSNSIFIAYTDETVDYEAFNVITDCRTDFPGSNTVTGNSAEVDNAFVLVSPVEIPIVGSGTTDPNRTTVVVKVKNFLQYYDEFQSDPTGTIRRKNAYVTLKLGNLEKQIHINQRNAISAAGDAIKYMPTNNRNPKVKEVNYYCLSGIVESGAKNWIKLRPSTGEIREDTDNITVDDGKIFIEVMPNTGAALRRGIVYLTTINNNSSSGATTQRIKIDITQLGV